MKIAGLTLTEIAKTHKDNELVKELVKALVDAKITINLVVEANPTIDLGSSGAFKYVASIEIARRFLERYE